MPDDMPLTDISNRFLQSYMAGQDFKRKKAAEQAAKQQAEFDAPKYTAGQFGGSPWAKGLPADFPMRHSDVMGMAGRGVSSEAQKGNKELSNLFKIKSDYEARSKGYNEVRDSYNRVIASAKDPSPAGDMALLFNYMKVLDPGSTVREGEFAQAARTGSLPQAVQAYASKLATGERLTPEQRADFVKRTQALYKQQESSYLKSKQLTHSIAQQYGIDPALVITDYEGTALPLPAEMGGPQAPGPMPGAVPSPTPQKTPYTIRIKG